MRRACVCSGSRGSTLAAAATTGLQPQTVVRRAEQRRCYSIVEQGRSPSALKDTAGRRLYSTPHTTAGEPHISCTKTTHPSGGVIGTIVVNNVKKLNIVNTELLIQMKGACTSLATDPNLRAVVLTGASFPPRPAAFIGGTDITEMHALDSPQEAQIFIHRVHRVCQALRDLPVPVIARVDGICLGAGLEIMAACDLRIASDDSVFGMPEVKLGIPSVVEAALLPGLIGWGRTRRFLYLAENIDAETAEKWGLVEKVVDDQDLDQAVDEWVDKVVGMGPNAIRIQKQLIHRWEGSSIHEGIEAGVEAFGRAFEDHGREPKQMFGRFLNRKRY